MDYLICFNISIYTQYYVCLFSKRRIKKAISHEMKLCQQMTLFEIIPNHTSQLMFQFLRQLFPLTEREMRKQKNYGNQVRFISILRSSLSFNSYLNCYIALSTTGKCDMSITFLIYRKLKMKQLVNYCSGNQIYCSTMHSVTHLVSKLNVDFIFAKLFILSCQLTSTIFKETLSMLKNWYQYQ